MASLSACFRAGVAASVDPGSGAARDRDRRADTWIEARTLAGSAPLLCGTDDERARDRLLAQFASERWCGHPGLAAGLPPSTRPDAPEFHPRAYWRGPQWPVIGWLFGWALRRQGLQEEADRLRDEGLRLLAGGEFGEYYQPFTGEPLGSRHQSWTAAVALDWEGGV
jgi:glucosylglycerate hydrolase